MFKLVFSSRMFTCTHTVTYDFEGPDNSKQVVYMTDNFVNVMSKKHAFCWFDCLHAHTEICNACFYFEFDALCESLI